MTEVTRRERIRAATETEIRQHARALLVEHGRDAVTLRAIARELGITAPALYRYYDSRDDLLQQLRDDICGDLAAELLQHLEPLPHEDFMGKVSTVCRTFRRWALAHPQEFTLVFATPPGDASGDGKRRDQFGQGDQFGSVFLGIVGPLMAEGAFKVRHDHVPAEMGPDLANNQEALAFAFDSRGIDMPPEALGTDAVFFLLRWWVRVYGHVALEVFGRFPFDVRHADRLFDSLLAELAGDIGMS